MTALAPLKKNQTIRGCNVTGCGSYGAGRGGREHRGIDFDFEPGEVVKSPVDGKVSRTNFRVYSESRPELKGMEIKTDQGDRVKLFYVKDFAPIGTRVSKGDYVARADDMKQYYSSSMPNHIHMEFWDRWGQVRDFTNWFKKSSRNVIIGLTLTALIIGGVITYNRLSK